MRRRNEERTIIRQRAFLAAFRRCVSVALAARAAGFDPQFHYDWLKSDGTYRAAWENVQEEAAQALEDEAVRRAHEGVKHTLYYKGKAMRTGRGRNSRIAYEVEYSDQLLIMLLKRFRPALYRERTETQVTGSLEIIDRLQAGRKRLLEMKANDGTNAG